MNVNRRSEIIGSSTQVGDEHQRIVAYFFCRIQSRNGDVVCIAVAIHKAEDSGKRV